MPAIVVMTIAIRITMRKLKWMPGRVEAGSPTSREKPSPPPALEKNPDMNHPAVSAPSAKKAT